MVLKYCAQSLGMLTSFKSSWGSPFLRSRQKENSRKETPGGIFCAAEGVVN